MKLETSLLLVVLFIFAMQTEISATFGKNEEQTVVGFTKL